AVAVVAVIVPVILVGAVVIVWIVTSLAESFLQLAAEIPDLVAHPPSLLTDIQAWLDARGIAVNLVASFESAASGLLTGSADLMVGAFGGALSAVGMLVDAIVVLSLAIFMAIDRESIQRLGPALTPHDTPRYTRVF